MTGYEMAHQQAEQLFRTVLPSQGMAVREGQIQLCHAMLDALFGRETALCDAGVGLGKTYAYLAAAILWQNQKPLAMRKSIVLSTASVALQDAILKEYIPLLSSALLQYGFIHKPILAVLRKGKERYEHLEGRLPVPLFKAPRGGQWFVEQFKRCENAVLLAGGPCWEGVDFPGDMVSLLVIVRLPFPMPDPVREARRQQYPDLHSYIQAEIVPEMQQKLRQGFGRAIRTEADSCAVAILDPRAAPGGRYHQAVLDALPDGIPVTTKIEDIEPFLRAHKSPDYFLPNSNHN